jgi:hypothetical protein
MLQALRSVTGILRSLRTYYGDRRHRAGLDRLYRRFVSISEGSMGDWQSPIMTRLWAAIDPVAPGAGSMFLLSAILYWVGFGLIGITLARRAPWLGAVAVVLGLTPPAFMFVGMIWRDVLFACVWLPALDLALGHRMVWSTADMVHVMAFQPFRQVVRDVGRAVV